MNNQPLPKPSQIKKTSNPNQSVSSSTTPPPSALNNKPQNTSSKTIFDGSINSSRIPLSQKKTDQQTENKSDEVKLPPTSLSALSSMSSNTIPSQQTNKQEIMPEKTVLGKPIPQVIRGEKSPLGTLQAQKKTVPSPRIVEEKTAPVPVASNKNINKKSDPKKSGGPKFASEQKSIFKFLPLIVGGLIILAVLGFVALKIFGGKKTTPLPTGDSETSDSNQKIAKRTKVPSEQKELVYWGLWEPEEVVKSVIADFEAQNPGVKVTYVKQSIRDYRERLQAAINTGKGPDIFRFHASWTPMFKSDLYPIPSSVISPKDFKDNYYPVVTDQLVVNGQYVGVPLMYDGLGLYYNEDILKSANETPPTTWAELRLLASKLTVKSASGIQRAGLAIGNASNVDHFSDILAVLMLQNGADFNNPNTQETKDALLFYTNFVLKDKVWNDKLPSSTIAFARGDVAMMFAPSWRAHDILAQNPDLKFKIMPLPQLSDERIAWASYWAEGINANSKNKELAAKFLGFLSKDENLEKFFSKASEIRSFGEIYPKASMADKIMNNKYVSSYLDDAAYAKSWYMNSFTSDNGINDQIIQYYKDGITSILDGEDVDSALKVIENGTKEVLKQYAVSSK